MARTGVPRRARQTAGILISCALRSAPSCRFRYVETRTPSDSARAVRASTASSSANGARAWAGRSPSTCAPNSSSTPIAQTGLPACVLPTEAPVPDHPTLRPAPDRAFTGQFHAARSSVLAAGEQPRPSSGMSSLRRRTVYWPEPGPQRPRQGPPLSDRCCRPRPRWGPERQGLPRRGRAADRDVTQRQNGHARCPCLPIAGRPARGRLTRQATRRGSGVRNGKRSSCWFPRRMGVEQTNAT